MKIMIWLQTFCLLMLAAVRPAAAVETKQPATEQAVEKKEKTPKTEISLPVNIPLFSPRFENFPLAVVEDDPITVKEVLQGLALAHEERPGEKSAGKLTYLDILNRIITTRLVVFEARNMGLDEMPAIKEMIDLYQKQYLRNELISQATESVQPDQKEVEALYQDLTKEFKIKSVLFQKEAVAKKVSEEIKNGKDFDETVKKSIDNHESKGSMEEKYLKRRELLPEIAQAVSDMKPGAVTYVRIESGYVVLKLADIRPPQAEDAAAREEARQETLRRAKSKAILEFKQSLLKKYVKIDVKRFEKLDYEANESAFEKLLKDKRVLAEIQGETPITVADLSEAIQDKLYHGTKPALEGKMINEKKLPVLNEMLSKRLELKEVRNRGLDKTPDSIAQMKDIENSVLFDAFIQKAIVPDIHPSAGDLKAYYESHQKEYMRPKMIKLSSIAFKDKKNAEAAVKRLRTGTDMKWIRANADGIASDAPDLAAPNFPVLISNLPPELRKAVESARPGGYVLYSNPKDVHYAVRIAEVIPEKVQPFAEVGQKIKTIVFNDQLKKALETWSSKLRAAYTVKVYLRESQP